MRFFSTLRHALLVLAAAGSAIPMVGRAQDTGAATEGSLPPEQAGPAQTEFTATELQELAAPVALYPDTLLIQILVAATYPLDIIKADRFVKENRNGAPDSLQSSIDAQGWDDSVAVLATAFPDTLSRMAEHIEWTETVGTAMLVQSDDLLDAVQVKRAEAARAGNLESGEELTVSVTQEDNGDDTIIIEPSDPQLVYVPEYSTQTVYAAEDTTDSALSDALAAGLIVFGTAIVIDAIFDEDDEWYGYWGCRNCGGWYGRPIYHDPKRVSIGNDRTVIVNSGDLNRGWQADVERSIEASRKIEARKPPGQATALPATAPNRGDALRRDLSERTGTEDISRPAERDDLPGPPDGRPDVPAPDGAAPEGMARPATAETPRALSAEDAGRLRDAAPGVRGNPGAERPRPSGSSRPGLGR